MPLHCEPVSCWRLQWRNQSSASCHVRTSHTLDRSVKRFRHMVKADLWGLQYRDGAQSFLITQFGLSCFLWEGGQYQAHTFNFYLFPLPMLPGPSRRFMCDVRLSELVLTYSSSLFSCAKTGCCTVLGDNCQLASLQASFGCSLAKQAFHFRYLVSQGLLLLSRRSHPQVSCKLMTLEPSVAGRLLGLPGQSGLRLQQVHL
jgi:hypothetical protein